MKLGAPNSLSQPECLHARMIVFREPNRPGRKLADNVTMRLLREKVRRHAVKEFIVAGVRKNPNRSGSQLPTLGTPFHLAAKGLRDKLMAKANPVDKASFFCGALQEITHRTNPGIGIEGGRVGTGHDDSSPIFIWQRPAARIDHNRALILVHEASKLPLARTMLRANPRRQLTGLQNEDLARHPLPPVQEFIHDGAWPSSKRPSSAAGNCIPT